MFTWGVGKRVFVKLTGVLSKASWVLGLGRCVDSHTLDPVAPPIRFGEPNNCLRCVCNVVLATKPPTPVLLLHTHCISFPLSKTKPKFLTNDSWSKPLNY